MGRSLNLVRNPDFRLGEGRPRHWVLSGGRGTRFLRPSSKGGSRDRPGIELVTPTDRGVSAFCAQELACVPGRYYRVEISAQGHVTPDDERGGLILRLRTESGKSGPDPGVVSPPLVCTDGCETIRAWWKAPPGIRRIQVEAGMERARGRVLIEEARFFRILEPDEESHVWAVPPPAHLKTAPYRVDRAVVWTHFPRPKLMERIERLLGARGVSAADAQVPLPEGQASDSGEVLLIPDEEPPRGLRSLRSLLGWAEDRVVIVSLSTFAAVARGKVRLRDIQQADDPIHARVVWSGFATAGFALHDVFPLSRPVANPHSFAQRQYRKTPELTEFLRRQGMQVVLESMCDRDRTSHHPICLQRITDGGALFVLDLEPIEAIPSTMGEPALAMHLLASILGRSESGLGQYVVPDADSKSFNAVIRELESRFDGVRVFEGGVPPEAVTQQLVTVGPVDHGGEASLNPRPLILIRSGLERGDAESVYGALQWFKQYIRPRPYSCPYGDALASRFRIAWLPSIEPWQCGRGWRRGGAGLVEPPELELEDAGCAVLIDVVSRPENRIRVLIPSQEGRYVRYGRWLPLLWRAFMPGGQPGLQVPPDVSCSDRRDLDWRRGSLVPKVVVDDSVIVDPMARTVADRGGEIVRIEVPGGDADFPAQSIARTNLVAAMLEQVIGLQYGILVVNRTREPVQVDGFPVVPPGDLLVVPAGGDPLLAIKPSRVG